MNGFLIISLESGMLLHSEIYRENFGLNSVVETLQLSSILYAVYSLSHELNGDTDEIAEAEVGADDVVTSIKKSPVDFFQQDNIFWHYYECNEGTNAILMVLSADLEVNHSKIISIASALSRVYMSHNLPTSQSPRASVVKQLRLEMRHVINTAVDEMANSILNAFPDDVCALCVCSAIRVGGGFGFGIQDQSLSSNDFASAMAIAQEWNGRESENALQNDDTEPEEVLVPENLDSKPTPRSLSMCHFSQSASNLSGALLYSDDNNTARPGTSHASTPSTSDTTSAECRIDRTGSGRRHGTPRRRRVRVGRGPLASTFQWLRRQLRTSKQGHESQGNASGLDTSERSTGSGENSDGDKKQSDHSDAFNPDVLMMNPVIDEESLEWRLFHDIPSSRKEEHPASAEPFNSEPLHRKDTQNLAWSSNLNSSQYVASSLTNARMRNLLTQMIVSRDGIHEFSLTTSCAGYDSTSPENKHMLAQLHDVSTDRDNSIILHRNELDRSSLSSSLSYRESGVRESSSVRSSSLCSSSANMDSVGVNFDPDDYVRIDWVQVGSKDRNGKDVFVMIFRKAGESGCSSCDDGNVQVSKDTENSLTRLLNHETEQSQVFREWLLLSKNFLAL